MLPEFTELIDGMLEAAVVQRASVREAADAPETFDDDTLNRIIETHDTQLKEHWLFDKQFTRWKREVLTNAEATELHRLIVQSKKLKRTNEGILSVMRRLGETAIDKIVTIDIVEHALAAQSEEYRPPR